MKNAMKKLMSVLLVAVLLISAIPFAASADGEENLVAPQSNEQREITINLTFNDGSATQSYRQAIPIGTTVAGVLKYCMGEESANALMVKYKRDTGAYSDVAVAANSPDPLNLAFQINTNDVHVTVYADTTTEGDIDNLPYGTVLNLGSDILNRANMSIPADRAIDYIKVNGEQTTASSITVTSYTSVEVYTKLTGSNNSGNNNNTTTPSTAAYVDVILVTNKTSGFVDGEFHRCYLVDGKISQADRNAVASKISGKNIVAWKRADNGTQTDTLLNFDFNGLAAPINILPVVGTTNNSGSNNTGSNNSSTNNSGISTKDNTNQVWLHVYINGNASTINKSINLTGTYLMDDNSTNTTEILNYLLTNYYKSSDSTKNVVLDGLYINTGSSGTFPQNYYTDNKSESLSDIKNQLANGYIHINVMLKNVTAKTATTATADSSNPKTGDSIYTAMTVMGISAATLAAVMYVYTKKRQAI